MAKLPDDITIYSFTVRSVWFYALLALTALNTLLTIWSLCK